jgi:hypothetical protein
LTSPPESPKKSLQGPDHFIRVKDAFEEIPVTKNEKRDFDFDFILVGMLLIIVYLSDPFKTNKGGGTTSFCALQRIKEKAPDSKVLLVSEEKYLPYPRPQVKGSNCLINSLSQTWASYQR